MTKKSPKIQFHQDQTSWLVMKDPKHFPNHAMAKARYDTHNNGENNVQYVEYQKRIFDDFIGIYLKPGKTLDFGCGEGGVLSQFIPNLALYDLYYHPNQMVLKQNYDNIILIEVIEHFDTPLIEFNRLVEMLNPNGRLIIQTQFYTSFDDIPSWWYVRDATHVAFYHLRTFDYLCKQFGLHLIYTDEKSRIVLEKTVL
jgi:hypothetical protein